MHGIDDIMGAAEGCPASKRAAVHIVDDDVVSREATALLLRAAGHRVVRHASGCAFLSAVEPTEPGCVVLDLNMPYLTGIDVVEKLTAAASPLKVVIVTGHGDVALAVRSMKAGAVDFIQKPYEAQFLLDAVTRALQLSVRQSELGACAAQRRIATLSRRERQVLEGMISGKRNRDIADELGLSPRTVEMHRANMMEKLGVGSLPEALRIAYRAQLV